MSGGQQKRCTPKHQLSKAWRHASTKHNEMGQTEYQLTILSLCPSSPQTPHTVAVVDPLCSLSTFFANENLQPPGNMHVFLQVTYTDGTISPPWARERPFLLFDKLGHPSYLYTGRAYGPTNVMPAGFDYTYTMVQEVAS